MRKKLEAALAAQAKTLGKRGGDEAASEPPDRLFDRLAGALSSMLRDVVPDHEKCVREARGRAIVEADAAKQAKKEKLRQEAASRRERLKKDKGDGGKDKGGERPSAGASEDMSEGSDSTPGSAPRTPDRRASEPTGSRVEPITTQ